MGSSKEIGHISPLAKDVDTIGQPQPLHELLDPGSIGAIANEVELQIRHIQQGPEERLVVLLAVKPGGHHCACWLAMVRNSPTIGWQVWHAIVDGDQASGSHSGRDAQGAIVFRNTNDA